MSSYIDQIDAAAPDKRWALARNFLLNESLPFFAEMREHRPLLELPELTMAFRFNECTMVLRRHQDFGVDLYEPKQGNYFMAQDDTADHWRDKSVMRSIIDFEQVPDMRAFVGETTARILRDAKGRIDAPQQLTRDVPVALVQKFFGINEHDPKDLIEWSYWNQQDAFHNQPFDVPFIDNSEEIIHQRKRANFRLGLYIARLVAERAVAVKLGHGGENSISRLLRLSFSGGIKFPIKKVLFNVGGLLIGAVETTSHTVNNVLAELFARPDVLAAARKAAMAPDPKLFDGFVMEALRFRPAFPYFFRTCHRPTELCATTPFAHVVQPGTTVLAVTHSAMLDASVFPDPNRFDATRSQADNFTFGYGLHECLGRPVAQVMVPEIVRQCLRIPDLHPTGPVQMKGGVPDSYPLAWAA